MFPNIKKVKILTPIISNETMQSKVYTTIISPQFCVIDRKLNGICLVEKFHQFTKKKKNPPTTQQQTCKPVATLCLQITL